MKIRLSILFFFLVAGFVFQGCEDNDDIALPTSLQINDFIWKGLNINYLWQADVSNLADNRFPNQGQYTSFLSNYTPEDLFNVLRIDKSIDRFSWIVSDYTVLEQALQGTTKNNGIEFGLSYKPGSQTEIIGYVRYIIPGSDAATKNIKRGDIFYAVNNVSLTISNYSSLLYSAAENYSLSFADFDGTNFIPNGKVIDFTKTVLNENPIFINKIINSGSHKIGYLMYNGFYSNYDVQLNNAFGFLKSEGITDLVLDLRYNGGGSVLTATRLASMITGQFTNQVFTKLTYNKKKSANNVNYLFPSKISATEINSLNLSKIYILTTQSTASASELIINGLSPYINVIQIGDVTYGKNVASVTLYDSSNFSSSNRNPDHKYAMQPIVAKSVNKNGFGEYEKGLVPNHSLKESLRTLGVLGDASEPLLSTAIGKITGTSRWVKQTTENGAIDLVNDSKTLSGRNELHIE
ncbi:S41 family peptidase [Flavobacterium sp. NG2]|uniref:S41 family peptidase n=1 Tax=Flavobacterium sp. NG2 TaxID=3097547 RepID=UPI002A81A331|nr:S41 family peptidase [Flavobacterium sp. NG2]WPR73087.1 S41 family peptidase [Flavobacterium sp. NG2]